MIDLSLILPVHNQADIIEAVYKEVLATLKKLGVSYECILVENGSTDSTRSVVFHLAKIYPNTQALTAPIGYGSAVLAGLSKSRGKYVCYMPSDGQIDLSVFPTLWKLSRSGQWDVVKVKRITRETVTRLLLSRTLAYLVTLLFGIPAWDTNGSPRILLRSKMQDLDLRYKDSFIDTEFAVKAHSLKWHVTEIPMKTLPRYGGKSTRSWKTFMEFFTNLWQFRIHPTATIVGKNFYNEEIYSNEDITKKFTDATRRPIWYKIQKVLEIYRPNASDIALDIGCGWATITFAYAPLCRRVTGLDFSRESIKLCNRLLKQKKCTNVNFVCATAERTGLPAASYSVVAAADVFEHLYPNQSIQVMDECRRVLKKGGKFIIWTPHRGHILEILKNHDIMLQHDVGHVDYKSMAYFHRELPKHGFIIKKAYYTESHLPMVSAIERMLLPFIPIARRRIAVLAEKS